MKKYDDDEYYSTGIDPYEPITDEEEDFPVFLVIAIAVLIFVFSIFYRR